MNSTELQSTASHYDNKISDLTNLAFGSTALPKHFRASYAFAEGFLSQHHFKHGLDFCCGTGVHTFTLAKHSEYFIGVDVSQNSIQYARNKASALGIKNGQFVLTDAFQFLKNRNQEFDIITSYGCLYYFNLSELIPLLKQNLNKDGYWIGVETMGSNWILSIYRRLRYFFSTKRDAASKNNLFKKAQVDFIISQFAGGNAYYFDFFTLLSPLFAFNSPIYNLYIRSAQKIDFILLNKLGFSFLAFKVLLIVQNQNKN